MMKTLFAWIFLTSSLFSESVGEDMGQFAFSLAKVERQDRENIVYSPYGIFSNLALLYFGAQNKTADQIQSAIHLSVTDQRFFPRFYSQLMGFTQPQEGGYQLNIATGLFPHQGTHILKRFGDIATQTFQAKVQAVDYGRPDSTLETINNWVSEKTEGYIPQMLSQTDLDDSIRLVATTAVYFQGAWVHPFNSNQTKTQTFHPEWGEKVEVKMLQQEGFFPYIENEKVRGVLLPIARKEVAQPFLECVILMPKEGSLEELEADLNFEEFNRFLYAAEPKSLHLEIPKFAFSKRLLLNDTLKALGMKLPFTYQADFAQIDGMKDLFLNNVFHETYFSFHEKGITAASATTSTMGITSAGPRVDDATAFIANRPFLFFLVDYHSRAILFMGRLMKPETDERHES